MERREWCHPLGVELTRNRVREFERVTADRLLRQLSHPTPVSLTASRNLRRLCSTRLGPDRLPSLSPPALACPQFLVPRVSLTSLSTVRPSRASPLARIQSNMGICTSCCTGEPPPPLPPSAPLPPSFSPPPHSLTPPFLMTRARKEVDLMPVTNPSCSRTNARPSQSCCSTSRVSSPPHLSPHLFLSRLSLPLSPSDLARSDRSILFLQTEPRPTSSQATL